MNLHDSKMIRKLATYLGGLIFIVIFTASIPAYFVTKTDAQTHIIYDGLGRALSESPFFIRIIFGQDRLWAGWSWFIGDMVIFWGSVGIAFGLISFGSKENKNTI